MFRHGGKVSRAKAALLVGAERFGDRRQVASVIVRSGPKGCPELAPCATAVGGHAQPGYGISARVTLASPFERALARAFRPIARVEPGEAVTAAMMTLAAFLLARAIGREHARRSQEDEPALDAEPSPS